jgi:hypothetical protein
VGSLKVCSVVQRIARGGGDEHWRVVGEGGQLLGEGLWEVCGSWWLNSFCELIFFVWSQHSSTSNMFSSHPDVTNSEIFSSLGQSTRLSS